MFNLNADSKIRGPGYIILNVLRALNVIVLLLVAVASWVMLVMTVKTSSFFFFDGVSHFITSSMAIFLIISEVSLFKPYFAQHWPLLSNQSGFVPLGLAMMALGFNILGNLNKPATSVENLGLPLWRVVISAGILSAVFGLFNIVATYVFCDFKLGITGRQVRSHGAAIPEAESVTGKTFSHSSGSTRSRRPQSPVLPTYTQKESRRSRWTRFPIISKPISQNNEQFSKWESRSSPVLPAVQRPPTAQHPFHRTEMPEPPPMPYARSSMYSEAHLSRF